MFLISQNRRKNPGTNVGVEFPTFYIYKNPSMKDQKEISWRFLETFYDEKNKRVFISLKKVAVWFNTKSRLAKKRVQWYVLQLPKSSPGLFSHPTTE
jgi:hypothetical protein